MKSLPILAGTCCVLLLATATVHADEKRGFYVDVGVGLGGASYGSEVDDLLDVLDDNGFKNVTLSLDLAVGGAVRQNLYLVGSVSAFGDRYFDADDSDEYLQVNTILYGAGVRYYPLPSQKHLLLGADLGLARMVLQTSADGVDDMTSDSGFGFRMRWLLMTSTGRCADRRCRWARSSCPPPSRTSGSGAFRCSRSSPSSRRSGCRSSRVRRGSRSPRARCHGAMPRPRLHPGTVPR